MKTVIIVGAGPAGLFAAYTLCKDFNVIVMDKGKSLIYRKCVVREGKPCINCKPCNIMCGFGGAGTFSDCKLSLTPLVGADSHCKIASATRKLLQIIRDLKEVNRLDLLEPITAALRSEGIYLEVDESENDVRPEINQALDNMARVREYVKNLADEKKKLAEETAANAICTEKCFNSTVMAMKKVDKNPDKLD